MAGGVERSAYRRPDQPYDAAQGVINAGGVRQLALVYQARHACHSRDVVDRCQ